MGRLACLSLPALPLQLLLRQHPEWKDRPVAVVAEQDSSGAKIQGLILYVNRAAARAGVRPGLRYGAGLSLEVGLRGGVIAPEAMAKEVEDLSKGLQRFTPHVEASSTQPGVFWLSADGLTRVHPSLKAWGAAVLTAVAEAGLVGSIVIGGSRFGVYALATATRGVTEFVQPREELEAARRVPLARLDMEPDALLRLQQLGIRTVGEFAALPEAGILERFGTPAHRLHRMASGALAPVLEPATLLEPAAETVLLEYPETALETLLFLIKGRLHPLLGTLAARRQGLAELELRLRLEGGAVSDAGTREHTEFQPEKFHHTEHVRPSAPTLDDALIVDLVRLRLESVALESGVIAIGMLAHGGPALMEQLRLFTDHPRRDLRAGEQALARLRAEFGNEVAVRAELRDGHLPEAQFAWVPVERLSFPKRSPAAASQAAPERALVRRLMAKPQPVDEAASGAPTLLASSNTVRRHGPYPISGGWWRRFVQRDYYFAETVRGELLWVYYDRQRRQWFSQGRVE